MSSSKITGKEYPLYDIFSSDFDYYIPAYQRPYAWSEEEAETLYDDLYSFFTTEKTENYFLGSIVLIKDDNNPRSDVIDGQQRLTTLTILFAAIASRLPEDVRGTFMTYLLEPGNVFQGLDAKPRLHLRERDRQFFEAYIQNGQIDELLKVDPKQLPTEAQQHILSNARVFMNKLTESFGDNKDDLVAFSGFLVSRCYLVAVYTASQQSAFRVFSVMNSRGMDLLPIDIIKADIIGQIDTELQTKYTNKWEDLENATTRTGFNELFMHTRMIFAKAKARKGLLEEFRQYVIPNHTPIQLIDEVLEPFTYAYQVLKKQNYEASSDAGQINNYLSWLNRIDNSDWMPCAIKFLAERRDDPAYVLWFIKRLERMAAFMHATSKDVNRRIERYSMILHEMEERPDHSINDPLSSLELTAVEKRDFISALNGDIYRMTSRRRNYIILRLDSFVSDGAASYEPAVLTIEHVLPQTVRDDSTWAEWWPDPDEREVWVHKIANLVPLTRPHNSEASNLDFDVKKKTYFTGRNGTTSYSLTTQVIREADWKPLMVEHRQTMLLDVFREKWELSYDEEELKKETSAKGEKSKTQSPSVNLDKIRLAYWTYALPIIQKQNSHRGTFTNCGARKYSETWGYFGLNGFHVSCTTGNDSAAVYFYMGNSDTDVNKNAFDLLMSHKEEIEDRLGVSLNWDRANNNKASWISYLLHGVSIMNEADWPRMAEFQAEWSDKICNTLLPYVLVEDDKTKRIREISDYLREWAANKTGINVAWHKCSPSYLRFTTDAMDAVIPDYDVLSGWDTKDHYFYEIRNTFSDKVYIQFAVNSKGLTAEEKQLYEKIYEFFPMGKHSENWSWRLHFKSSKVEIGENISKEAIFYGLDKCYLELLKFEQELISKLKEDDTE